MGAQSKGEGRLRNREKIGAGANIFLEASPLSRAPDKTGLNQTRNFILTSFNTYWTPELGTTT